MNDTRDDDPRRGARLDEAVTCAAYREDIPLVVGGDLEPEVLDLLVWHLARCEPCARETAAAAAARDVLLGGLAAGAHEWHEPELWRELEPALPQRTTPVHSFRERAFRAGRRLALPLAAAAVVVMALPREPTAPAPTPSSPLPADPLAPSPLAPGPLAAGGADEAPPDSTPARLASTIDPVFDRYGPGLVPAALEAGDTEILGSLPRGFGVPLNARQLEELKRTELRVQVDGSVVRIRDGLEQTLASFPR